MSKLSKGIAVDFQDLVGLEKIARKRPWKNKKNCTYS